MRLVVYRVDELLRIAWAAVVFCAAIGFAFYNVPGAWDAFLNALAFWR
jgi:hypothetical protein